MNARRRLQSMLLPLTSAGDADEERHGHGRRRPRRGIWLALGSLVALALLSMYTLGTAPALRARAGMPAPKATAPQNTAPPAPVEPALAQQRKRVAAVAESLARISQRTTQPRGIVLPLFDGIATLGISLILELREIGVDLPIEIPHCGDLDARLSAKLTDQDPRVRVYDVCLEASSYSLDRQPGRKLFCSNLANCHRRFRGFDIKIIALLLSRFDEVMMLDADTLFFQTPMRAWQSKKYVETGTLFFHDRISCDHEFLAVPRNRGDGKTISHLQEYLSNFDSEPFRSLAFVPRPRAVASLGPWLGTQAPVALPFTPSDFLLKSHSWNRRAGHQADSSMMLWNKKKQVRATAILGSFIAIGGVGRPPSYGDKEFYFIACELAETDYAFSDFGTGSIGVDVRQLDTPGNSVLCGDALHYMPDDHGASDQPTLYINSDRILEYKPTDVLYRSRARPASLYPGKIEDRQLAQACPFDVTVEKITEGEKDLIARRQKFHETALSWKPPTEPPTTAPPTTATPSPRRV